MNYSIWPVSVDIPHKNHYQHQNNNGLPKGALDLSTKWLKSSIPEVFRHPTPRGMAFGKKPTSSLMGILKETTKALWLAKTSIEKLCEI